MLNFKLQLFVILISLLVMGYIVYLIRRELIELRYSSMWLVVGALLIVIAVQPYLVAWIARLVGIGLPVNALFLVASLFLLVMMLVLTIAISKLSLRQTRLTQEIALLKAELQAREAARPRRRAR